MDTMARPMLISMNRRALLFAGLSVRPLYGLAQQRRSLADPLRLGVDVALHESGLAQALQRGFGRDTGVAVKLIPAPAQSVLQALEQGEIDASLCNSPSAEARLVALGYAHERVAVALSEFVIVGPLLQAPAPGKAPKPSKAIRQLKPPKPRDPAGLAGIAIAAQALQRLIDATAEDASIQFLSANDGSGTHATEQAIWRAAKLAPVAPWYQNAGAVPGLIALARTQGKYALVERGAWAARGGPPLAVLVQGDPILRVPVHLMRSFRSKHAASKLFSAWLTGPKGRGVVAVLSGYRIPS